MKAVSIRMGKRNVCPRSVRLPKSGSGGGGSSSGGSRGGWGAHGRRWLGGYHLREGWRRRRRLPREQGDERCAKRGIPSRSASFSSVE